MAFFTNLVVGMVSMMFLAMSLWDCSPLPKRE